MSCRPELKSSYEQSSEANDDPQNCHDYSNCPNPELIPLIPSLQAGVPCRGCIGPKGRVQPRCINMSVSLFSVPWDLLESIARIGTIIQTIAWPSRHFVASRPFRKSMRPVVPADVPGRLYQYIQPYAEICGIVKFISATSLNYRVFRPAGGVSFRQSQPSPWISSAQRRRITSAPGNSPRVIIRPGSPDRPAAASIRRSGSACWARRRPFGCPGGRTSAHRLCACPAASRQPCRRNRRRPSRSCG